MEKIYKILVINMGSTSTKVAYYENEKSRCEKNLSIDKNAIAGFKSIFDQYDLRRKAILDFLDEIELDPKELDFIVSRGCGGGNQKGGAYMVNEELCDHCRNYEIPHASSLGPVIAYDLSSELGIPAFIYDSDGVNEFHDLALLSGLKEFPIAPGSHTLNAKAAARKAAERLGGKYKDFNIVVCHLGGGSSTSIHRKGMLIDSTCDAYAAERAGGMPFLAVTGFISGCFSGKYTQGEIMKLFMGKGGLMSYLGTSDLREVENRIGKGDKEARYYFDGMVYQQSKDIAAMASVVNMDVDAIVLTGGMAHSDLLCQEIEKRVKAIAPVLRVPGSLEMDALAEGGLRVIRGEENYHLFGAEETEEMYL